MWRVALIWLSLCAGASAQSNSLFALGVGSITAGPFVASCSQSATYIAALTSPTATEKSAFDYAICHMVTHGTFALLDGLYIHANTSAANARINAINPGTYNLTGHGSCTFTADQGFTGDGSSCYNDPAFVPSTAGGHVALNSQTYGVCVLNNRTTPSGSIVAYGGSGASSGFTYFEPLFTGSLSVSGLADGSNNVSSITSSQGSWISSRTGSSGAGIGVYSNGAGPLPQSSSSSSTSLPNVTVVEFAYNSNGSIVDYSTDQQAYWFFGAGMTSAQVASIYGDLGFALALLGNTNCAPVLLPSTPAPASTWSYTNLRFFDNFCNSTVDVNNTKSSAYNWFTNNAWPNMFANGTVWAALTAASATPSADIITGYCGLQLLNDVSKLAVGVNTCVYTSGTGAGSAQGKTFSGGFYMEVTAAFNSALATSAAASWESWPIAWTVPVGFFTGVTTGDFVELDTSFQAFPTGAGTVAMIAGLHDWNNNSNQNNANTNYNINSSITGNLNQYHKYGTLWVPASLNSGTGLVQYYYDGTHITAGDISYTATGPSSPGATPSNPNGTFSTLDNQALCIILGGGYAASGNWPGYFANVQIWAQ